MPDDKHIEWSDLDELEPYEYTCGHCGTRVRPDRGKWANDNEGGAHAIFMCSYCTRPTYVDEHDTQFPGALYGDEVNHLPAEIETLYGECRRAMSAGASTLATMGLRTLLAHVAVERGAPVKQTFQQYVSYLVENHLVPLGADKWLDHVRTSGNEAIHDLRIVGDEDAEELLEFTSMVLHLVYEFPTRGAARAARRAKRTSGPRA